MATIVSVPKTSSGDAYDILIEHDFAKLKDAIIKLGFSNKRFCIVTDSNVGPLYADKIVEELSSIAKEIKVLTLPAGEENKNLEQVQKVYEFLIENHFDRKDILFALGGGVIGDLTGFAAATYLRGIKFVQIPTTLLSQTDSSIGGKTGVDFNEYKNMVGAFYQPSLVYMNMSVLKTLSARQFASGMAEILKHGLIKDNSYYEWLINNFIEINDLEAEFLEKMIKRSCEIKAEVVSNDPKEQGERAILNFGHTVGHAIEKYMNFKLTHGECVALGMIAACWISYKRGMLDTEEFYEIRDMFLPFRLPLTLEDDADLDRIIEITKSDKKMESGHIKFILLKKPGKAYIDTSVTDDEMRDAVKQLILTDD
ncbi:3-dehydroquinate synthase [Lachnospiraceae bacterium KH1T2]|nr:3-dehydroquinate synthase [Lachnospiraceae bacterium KH1T2]